jgi:hypothetical protein
MYDDAIDDELAQAERRHRAEIHFELIAIHGGLEEVAIWLRNERNSGHRAPQNPADHITRAARAIAHAQPDPHQWRRELVAAAANILSWIQRNPLAALPGTEEGEK